MMRNQISRYGRPAAQFFSGGIALASVTVVSLRFEAGLATTAFGYLLVIVLLSLMGSFFVSAILSLVAVGAPDTFSSPAVFHFPFHLVLVVPFFMTPPIRSVLLAQARGEA